MAENNDPNIISGVNLVRKFINPKTKASSVIRAEEVKPRKKSKKVQIVGGDSEDAQATPPAIIIEKDGDRIARIIVKCPCGRHAELVCEYDEEEPEEDDAEI